MNVQKIEQTSNKIEEMEANVQTNKQNIEKFNGELERNQANDENNKRKVEANKADIQRNKMKTTTLESQFEVCFKAHVSSLYPGL